MTDTPAPLPGNPAPRWINGWRIAGWGSAAALLTLPAIAMRFTTEVNWTASDFVFMGILLLVTGLGLELAFRVSRDGAHRAGMIIAVLGGFFLVWSNLAVGILGSEREAINLGFFAILLAGIVASLLVRFRARAMAAIMAAMALGYGAMAAAGYAAGFADWPVTLMFVTIAAASALCFRRAGRRAAN